MSQIHGKQIKDLSLSLDKLSGLGTASLSGTSSYILSGYSVTEYQDISDTGVGTLGSILVSKDYVDAEIAQIAASAIGVDGGDGIITTASGSNVIISLDPTVAGDGLTYTNGVIDFAVGTTQSINVTVNGDDVDFETDASIIETTGALNVDGATGGVSSVEETLNVLQQNINNATPNGGDGIIVTPSAGGAGATVSLDPTVAGDGLGYTAGVVNFQVGTTKSINVTVNADDVDFETDATLIELGSALTIGSTALGSTDDVHNALTELENHINEVDNAGIAVVAGTGITVDATGVTHTISFNVGDGLEENAGDINVKINPLSSNYLTVDSNGLAMDKFAITEVFVEESGGDGPFSGPVDAYQNGEYRGGNNLSPALIQESDVIVFNQWYDSATASPSPGLTDGSGGTAGLDSRTVVYMYGGTWSGGLTESGAWILIDVSGFGELEGQDFRNMLSANAPLTYDNATGTFDLQHDSSLIVNGSDELSTNASIIPVTATISVDGATAGEDIQTVLNQLQTNITDSIVTADNGLTNNGGTIELGGTLNKNTTIDTSTYDFTIGNSSGPGVLTFDYVGGPYNVQSMRWEKDSNSIYTKFSQIHASSVIDPSIYMGLNDANKNTYSSLSFKSDYAKLSNQNQNTSEYHGILMGTAFGYSSQRHNVLYSSYGEFDLSNGAQSRAYVRTGIFDGSNYSTQIGASKGINSRKITFNESESSKMSIEDELSETTNRGIYYVSNYHDTWGATISENVLVPKGYVDDAISNAEVSVENGLTNNGGTISLGGPLNQNTTIEQGDYSLSFDMIQTPYSANGKIDINKIGSGLFSMESYIGLTSITQSLIIGLNFESTFEGVSDNSELFQDDNQLDLRVKSNTTLDKSEIEVRSTSVSLLSRDEDGSFDRIRVDNSLASENMTITSTLGPSTNRGIYYSGNYHDAWGATVSDRVLVPKGYVDDEIAKIEASDVDEIIAGTGISVSSPTGSVTIEANADATLTQNLTSLGLTAGVDSIMDALIALQSGGTREISEIFTTFATTSGDNSDTTIAVAGEPVDGHFVDVYINGQLQRYGTTNDYYFSTDGTLGNAVAQDAVSTGDFLVWNGTTSGFDLDPSTDTVTVMFDEYATA